MLDAWRHVLGTDDIGLDDDFFRVGGHSLLMTQLAARLVERSGLAPEFRDLHYTTTPRGQALLLAETGNLLLLRPPKTQGRDTWWRETTATISARFTIVSRMRARCFRTSSAPGQRCR